MNPRVFLNYNIYRAIFTVYPIPLILACGLVFTSACGESDLSFPSTVGATLWIFSLVSTNTGYPFLGLLCAILTGLTVGFINGILVTKLKLSSLVITLGMNFLLRGLINIGTSGQGISLVFLNKSFFYKMFVGRIGEFPLQMLWGFVFVVICLFLFNRHQFGAHICFVGDNRVSAAETGIKVDRVKIGAFMLIGFASAIAGILSGLINNTFWPTAGDSYLLTTMAAVYLGGTPYLGWGRYCYRRRHWGFYPQLPGNRHHFHRPHRVLYPVFLRPHYYFSPYKPQIFQYETER
ncbi:MAG: ABC transporter permease [Treponema sp.]|nr:ABC transporter permease [Treponema sp.]